MSCERYPKALSGVAAGAPAPPGLEAHLASCASCREELSVLRQALALADAELAGLVAADPSPGLVTRIRRAAAEADRRESAFGIQGSPAWRFGWPWPAVALGALAVVGLVVTLGRGPGPQTRVGAGNPAGPAGVGSTGPAGASSPAPSAASREARPPVVGLQPPEAPLRPAELADPAEPEVLVPPGEGEALLRFAEHLRHRIVAPDSLLVADLSAPLPEPKAIEIAPLEIVPLDPAETTGTD